MLLPARNYNEEARRKFRKASCEKGGRCCWPEKGFRLNFQSYFCRQYLNDIVGLALMSTEANSNKYLVGVKLALNSSQLPHLQASLSHSTQTPCGQ